jgi:hypothetical protein
MFADTNRIVALKAPTIKGLADSVKWCASIACSCNYQVLDAINRLTRLSEDGSLAAGRSDILPE